MVNAPLSYLDFQDYDPEYFKNLKWLMENDIDSAWGLDLTFTTE